MSIQVIKWKLEGTVLRLTHAIIFLPRRLKRLLVHLPKIGQGSELGWVSPLPVSRFNLWSMELFFLLADVLAIPEVYESLIEWGKWKTRPLTDAEIEKARTIYGNSIHYKRVRVDETARIVSQKTGILYVSFYTINCWGKFDDYLLIHELMHVWQFHRFGSVYIPRALWAQRTKEGYNYGGTERLESIKKKGGSLVDFNFEQQGDIVADGFSLRNGLCPRWAEDEPSRLGVFEGYLEELKK